MSNEKLNKLNLLTSEHYKAFLYDCDGTLADNMEDHKETYVRVAKQQGVEIDAAIVDELAGYPITAVVEEINKRYGSQLHPEEFEKIKSQLFYDEYIPRTRPIGFVVEHLKQRAEKYKIAVVSGSPRRMVEKTVDVLGISKMIDVLICSEDYEMGKPKPDPFLLAAENLGVEPESCVVFEDGDPGVEAAEAAGMKWIRVDQL